MVIRLFATRLVAGKELKHALTRVGAATHVEDLFRIRGVERAAGKEILSNPR